MKIVALAMTLDRVQFKALLQKIVRAFNSFTCVVMNGGHEMYSVRHDGGNLRQRCLLCQHETKGVEIGPFKERK